MMTEGTNLVAQPIVPAPSEHISGLAITAVLQEARPRNLGPSKSESRKSANVTLYFLTENF